MAAPRPPLAGEHPGGGRVYSGSESAVTDVKAAHGRGASALQRHYEFVRWLIPVLERFPRSQKFLLGDRIQEAALSVLERLIEATYSRRPEAALHRANLELEKSRVLLRLAFDLRHLDLRRYEFAARALDETGRMVGAWLKATAVRRERARGPDDHGTPASAPV